MSELKIYGHEQVITSWKTPTPQREPKLKVTVNWSTRIVRNHRTGVEHRTPLITEPRYEIEGSDFILTNESAVTLSQAFFDTDGRLSSFPFKNPIDYYCKAVPEEFGEEIYQRGYLIPLGDGTGRIVKQFHCNGVATYKTVLHPIADTFVAYTNIGGIIAGLTVDETTGIISGVAGLDWIACDCEYRGRYRFDISELQLEQIKEALTEFDRNVYRTINFRLIEDSYDKIQGMIFSVDWVNPVDIGVAEITYSTPRQTRIESASSQRELREGVVPYQKINYLEHGGKDRVRMQMILTIFNCLKGRFSDFTDGRLSSDTLVIEQLGVNAFNIDGETRVKV